MLTYAQPRYAESLSEFGTPRRLEASRGSVLVREVAGCPVRDAMGCYPLFSCENWPGLREDLEALGDELVCLGIVADPHGAYDEELLSTCFDSVRVFKQHYIVDLEQPLEMIGNADRRKKARRALRQVEVQVCDDPLSLLDRWCGLYNVLVARHGITGIRAFSRRVFELQLSLPGTEVLTAVHRGELIAALIMCWQGDVVCGHLCAMNEEGYRLRASYALDWFSFTHYAGRARLVDLGGGTALADGGGLEEYKRGWATGTVPVRFCGRIFNRPMYDEITAARGVGETSFFPAYRVGEYR